MIQLKVLCTIIVDEEEYPIPADGKVEIEVEDYLQDVFHDMEGLKVKSLKSWGLLFAINIPISLETFSY